MTGTSMKVTRFAVTAPRLQQSTISGVLSAKLVGANRKVPVCSLGPHRVSHVQRKRDKEHGLPRLRNREEKRG